MSHTKINNSEKDGPLIISFSSGKGGVGKTSVTVNLAVSLATQGKRVLLLDGDLGLANVDIALGINARHTIREIVEDGSDPSDVLVKISSGFYVLPASSGVPEMVNLAYEEQAYLTDAVEQIIGAFDFVLVDSAAGIGESVLWFNQWARENVIILTPDPTSLTDAYALIKVLKSQYGKGDFKLVINSVETLKEGQAVFDNMARVLKNFLHIEPKLLGVIPRDKNVVQAIREQKPFVTEKPNCRASQAIMKMSDLVANLP